MRHIYYLPFVPQGAQNKDLISPAVDSTNLPLEIDTELRNTEYYKEAYYKYEIPCTVRKQPKGKSIMKNTNTKDVLAGAHQKAFTAVFMGAMHAVAEDLTVSWHGLHLLDHLKTGFFICPRGYLCVNDYMATLAGIQARGNE